MLNSEKDFWELTKKVVQERRKRELEPLGRILGEVSDVQGANTAEVKEFKKVIKELDTYSRKANNMLDKVVKADQHWFFGLFMKRRK